MPASRPLLAITLSGLLVASCGSGVVSTPYGEALTPPRVAELVPPAPEGPVEESQRPAGTEEPNAATAPEAAEQRGELAYDVAPRRPSERAADPNQQAYDVAPRQLPHAAAPVAPSPPPPATKVLLGPITFISQTVNNCGPASIAEVLGFWGIERTQGEVQSVLRGDGNPYGMTTAGVPSYIASLSLDVLLGTGGTADLMKELLRAGFPVIVNQTVSDTDPEFHFRPVIGFDEERGVFISADPLIGPLYTLDYEQFERVWGYTGHRFMVVYPPDKADQLNAALAAGRWDLAYAEGGGQAQPWSAPAAFGRPGPVTTAVLAGDLIREGWYAKAVTVTLRASDQTGFGVANTSYVVDNRPAQIYRGPFVVKDAGRHTVTFHSVNFSGSREADKSIEFTIGQGTAPITTATVDGTRSPNGLYRGFTRLILSATGEGNLHTTFSIDGGSILTYNEPLALGPGSHAITYGSVDQYGNLEVQHVLTVSVQAAGAQAAATGGGAESGSGASANVGMGASASGPPAGGFRVCPLMQGSYKSSTPIAIKLQLCDVTGLNLSSAAVPLTLHSMSGPPSGVKPRMPSAFRYEPGIAGYWADEPAGLGLGTYMVYFTASGDSVIHAIQFRITG